MKNHVMWTTLASLSAALLIASCGPSVNYTPDDPSDVRSPRPVEDIKLLAEGETPGPGYRTLGSVEVTAEVTCNTAMTQSKESAKSIIDAYVKSHMDLAESTSQEVVEAMVENGDLSKSQACKVLPIFAQIPEKEEILVAVLKGMNIDLLVSGTADAGGEGLYEVEHEVYKTRKKPALSGAGAVSPALVVNVKSFGKVITLKDEEPEPEPEEESETKVAKKPKKKTEEVVVVKKSEPPPEEEDEEDEGEEDEEETTVASAKKKETVVVKKTGDEKKEKPTAKAHADEPWPPPDDEEGEDAEELDPKAAAAKAKKEAEAAMLAVKEAKKQAKLAKLEAEKAEKEKKKAAMLKKMAEAKAEEEAAKQAKKEAKLAKKKEAEEAAAKKKAELEAKKKAKAEEEAKKKAEAEAKVKGEAKAKESDEGTDLKKADKETVNDAKDIIRGWKKEIFVCLHKSDKIETAGKVALMFFIDSEGQLDALSINPEPEPGIKDCIMKTVGDLDYPDVGVTYEFSMKYKVSPE